MHTTNYFEAFIEVADDCPVTKAAIPPLNHGEKTIARIHYEIIVNNPYVFTSDDVIFMTFAQKNTIAEEARATEKGRFFSKGQACLRSSPLTKRYGWGIHCNKDGKVAIYPVDSVEYQRYSSSNSLRHLKGMRTSKKQ